jgi:hypothetical protein
MSEDKLRLRYYSYFHSLITYGIVFWRNSSHSIHVFRLQKRITRIIIGSNPKDFCRLLKNLRILPLRNNTFKITSVSNSVFTNTCKPYQNHGSYNHPLSSNPTAVGPLIDDNQCTSNPSSVPLTRTQKWCGRRWRQICIALLSLQSMCVFFYLFIYKCCWSLFIDDPWLKPRTHSCNCRFLIAAIQSEQDTYIFLAQRSCFLQNAEYAHTFLHQVRPRVKITSEYVFYL